MDFLTTIVAHRLTIGVRGKIESDFKLPINIWKILEDNFAISEIIFVLRKIEAYDDNGIDAWKKEIARLSVKNFDLTFIECPKAMFESLLKDQKAEAAKNIRSFIVPYYCSTCNEEFPQLINTSSISLSFAAYSKPVCPSCEKSLSLDITEDEIQRIASLLPVGNDIYEDKRKYPRFDISALKIKSQIKFGSNIYEYELINFSEAGICITGSHSLETGSKILDIEISYHSKKVLSKGTVTWFSKESNTNYFIGISLETNDVYKLLIKA